MGPKAFLSPSGELDDYVNHSCEPNCGIKEDQGRVVLFALKPIGNGDEITFDDATTQAGGFWKKQQVYITDGKRVDPPAP